MAQQIVEQFPWSPASEEAAQLLAVGELSTIEIAEKVGCDRGTLWRWRQQAAFAARVEAHLEEIRVEIRRRGIGVVERRVASLDDRWKRLLKVIEQRGASVEMKDVPGGETGLLVRKIKKIGSGEDSEIVNEYAVDTGLLSELREHEKQAAQELGQWINRSNVEQTVKSYEVGTSPDDL
jgi:hypothetical protein